jgi:hypothetical protein
VGVASDGGRIAAPARRDGGLANSTGKPFHRDYTLGVHWERINKETEDMALKILSKVGFYGWANLCVMFVFNKHVS